MSCLDEDDVVALVEGTLAAGLRSQAQRHLGDCDACRALVAHTARALLPTADGELGEAANFDEAAAGALIGPYRVMARLGAGAMGVVYAAEHVKLRRRVALKIVRPDPGRAGNERQLRARLLREARAASAVRHPHVVTVHDVLELDDGSPVMVMDLLEGETLRLRLEREGRLTPRATLEVMVQVLSALECAHALGVVHRDLKPDNIFLVASDNGVDVKIVDFGIAKLTALDGPAAQTVGLTETGMLVGTPHYMAPEQAFQDGALDARADLWSAGVILYECLSGLRPVDGDSIGQILKQLARLEIRPLAEVAPSLPSALTQLVDRLLAEHDARPSSADFVRKALEDVVASGIDDAVVVRSAPAKIASDSADGVVMDRGSWLEDVRSRHAVHAGIGALVIVVFVSAFGRVSHAPTARVEPVPALPAVRDHQTVRPRPARVVVDAPVPTQAHAPVRRAPQRVRPNATSTPPAGAPESPPEKTPPPGPGKLLTEPPF